jgi:hypothetical protein
VPGLLAIPVLPYRDRLPSLVRIRQAPKVCGPLGLVHLPYPVELSALVQSELVNPICRLACNYYIESL